MKKKHWESKFFHQLTKVKDTPFKWGEHDCILFAARMVEIQTGHDYAAEHRGHYRSLSGAVKILKKATDQGDIIGLIDSILNKVPVLMAQRGDVVTMDVAGNPAAGICAGATCYFVGEEGLEKVPLSVCDFAWRVK